LVGRFAKDSQVFDEFKEMVTKFDNSLVASQFIEEKINGSPAHI
jgi:hypothetical protein